MTWSMEKVVVSGREFTQNDIEQIRQLRIQHPDITRTALSRKVCDVLHWFRPNGQRNDMTCRVALNRLEHMGLITLPPPIQSNRNGKWIPKITPASDPGEPINENNKPSIIVKVEALVMVRHLKHLD